MQTLCGGTALIIFGLVLGEGRVFDWQEISLKSMLAVVYLIVFGNLGFLAFSWLLKASTPERVSTYAYVNPVIAIVLGWVFAGETLSVQQLGGATLIVVSVVMIISFKRSTRNNRTRDNAPEETPHERQQA